MPSLAFTTVDVFTSTRFAGNPLAIVRVPTKQEPTTNEMQVLAREFNLSETIFLFDDSNTTTSSPPEWRVRIFLTDHEIPFAGHPTIGAACFAFATLRPSAPQGRFLCPAGTIEMAYTRTSPSPSPDTPKRDLGLAKASIPHAFHQHRSTRFTLTDVYALQPLLEGRVEPRAIDVVSPVDGMNFVCVHLADLSSLALVGLSSRVKVDLDDGWTGGFAGSYWYVVTSLPFELDGEVREGEGEGAGKVCIRTRMIEGSLEDPATGSAACGLCCLLALKWKRGRTMEFAVTQGVEMGRKSDIGVVVTLNEARDAIEKVELSGSAVKVMEGTVEY